MKKRYIVAATAALVGGGLLVEMQVGSKGLDPSQIAAPVGGGSPAGESLTGSGGEAVAVHAVARPRALRKAVPAIIEPVEEPAILLAANDDMLGLRAESSIWGDTAAINAILLSRGFAQAPTPGGNAGAAPGAAVGGSYPLAGEINRASGADALAAALRQPLAASTVPEPATWLSMIVGLAMIGFNLRRRQGRRSVAS